jgi:GNAT superfamily N-acetyltransferase
VTPQLASQLADLLLRSGEDPGARDLHTWGTSREALVEELLELEQPVVALEEGGGGVLVLDVAAAKGRAWAWGPAIDGLARPARADALFEDAVRRLPDGVTRLSAYPQVGAWMEAWWQSRGALPKGIVHVYRAERPARLAEGSAGPLRDPVPTDLEALARLHDAAFPATYLSPVELLEAHPRRRLLVADCGEGLVGYLCAESQRDGTGYIHFVAVDSDHRRRGLGRELLQAALRWFWDECGLSEAFLTVAAENDARHLYGQAGFDLLSSGQTLDLFLAPSTWSS